MLLERKNSLCCALRHNNDGSRRVPSSDSWEDRRINNKLEHVNCPIPRISVDASTHKIIRAIHLGIKINDSFSTAASVIGTNCAGTNPMI
jgi:hypothetical protein